MIAPYKKIYLIFKLYKLNKLIENGNNFTKDKIKEEDTFEKRKKIKI